jgi:hypothetical protein
MGNNTAIDLCIEELIGLCSAGQVPVLLAIQDSPNAYRALSANEDLATGHQLRLMRMLIKSGDIDSFLRDVIREAQKNGHNSLFLRAMGIPESPKL